jgi:hypothetical protein
MCDAYIKAYNLENYPLSTLLYQYRKAILDYQIAIIGFDMIDGYVMFSEEDKKYEQLKCEEETRKAYLAMEDARSIYYTAVRVYNRLQTIVSNCTEFTPCN